MNTTARTKQISYTGCANPMITCAWRRMFRLAIGLVCLVIVAAIAAPAQDASASSTKFARLLSLKSADGGYPTASLVQATDGNLYGTAFSFGENSEGTVFRISPDGALTTLYSFCQKSACTDGSNPAAPLIQANDGNLYGTSEYGGFNGNGTIFRITVSGALTTIYAFCTQSNCPDGSHPQAGLVQATDGNFYGTTQYGPLGLIFGTAFQLTPSGVLTTLHSFTGGTDWGGTLAGLVQASDGNLYGTAWFSNTACRRA